MKIETDGINPNVESEGDKVHRLVRATLGALPMFSGTAVELFSSLIEPPLERRKLEWMLQVTEVLNDLQDRFDVEITDLASNEKFISSLLHASQIAIKNHQDEKLEALKTAILNSARNESHSADQEFIFLNMVDEFSVSHLKILESTVMGFAWSPRTSTTGHGVWLEFSRILLSEFPEMKDSADLVFQIVTDLEARKMLRTFRIQNIQELPNNDISVMGVSEWGQLFSFKPAKSHRLDKDSGSKYVTLPTELGILFLNFIMCSE